MQKYAPSLLRVGLALVFLWFGFDQLVNTSSWLRLIPDVVISLSHLSATTLVHFNGSFEIIFGLALLAGFFTRTVALLLALHLMDIIFVVGLTSIGVRDFGLMIAAFSIFLHGADALSIDMLYFHRAQNRLE